MKELNRRLDRYFRELEDQHRFSGNVLNTMGNAHVYARPFGYASRTWGIPNDMGTRFDTATITKLFTAAATLQLIDQDKLSFDTSAIDFLKLKDTTISREVNVFHLLTHTSGIDDDVEEEDGVWSPIWKIHEMLRERCEAFQQ